MSLRSLCILLRTFCQITAQYNIEFFVVPPNCQNKLLIQPKYQIVKDSFLRLRHETLSSDSKLLAITASLNFNKAYGFVRLLSFEKFEEQTRLLDRTFSLSDTSQKL